MDAFGTTAPLGSVTVPLTEPKIACASKREGTSAITHIRSNIEIHCIVRRAAPAVALAG
jgi:hypothetical protein